MKKFQMSLTQRFSMLLMLFVGITVVVLTLLIRAKNEPIDFAVQEKLGNTYQRSVEKTLLQISMHRYYKHRDILGDKAAAEKVKNIEKAIDSSWEELTATQNSLGDALQFTEEGLKSRKREHIQLKTVLNEWNELKSKGSDLKLPESNDLHAHLIGDLRTMISHLGDTSNLILDPDLDSYYLMDITLLALPQSQDRIQNVMLELDSLLRSENPSTEDRIKANVFASMMSESDLERIKADFQTVLNEDPNFYGKSESLTKVLAPIHEDFVQSYKEMIDLVTDYSKNKKVSPEKFSEISEKALSSSFKYWEASVTELDTLLQTRIDTISSSKMMSIVISVIGLMITLGFAWFFMQYMVRNMNSIIHQLRSTSTQVSEASIGSASSATELSEATTEQAASVQETMASAEEISAMISQNADSAMKTKESVDFTEKVASEGSRRVEEMVKAIGEIKVTNEEILEQMDKSTKEFGEIVKIISEIGEKTNVINEIVFQTKLLSFNASVEAARAGEHGKGFAVVAEEVGNLAQMSGNAARDITEMLTRSIKRVNDIVETTKTRVDQLIEVGQDKISMGQATAEKCREALDKVTSNVKAVTQMITEISHASKEQAQGVQEINRAISQLDQVTQQNSSVAQKSSAQAEGLSSDANQLTNTISQLILFVQGTGSLSFSKQPADDSHPSNPSSTDSRVLQFQAPRKAAAPPSLSPSQKMFSTGEVVPSSNDPSFEEF